MGSWIIPTIVFPSKFSLLLCFHPVILCVPTKFFLLGQVSPISNHLGWFLLYYYFLTWWWFTPFKTTGWRKGLPCCIPRSSSITSNQHFFKKWEDHHSKNLTESFSIYVIKILVFLRYKLGTSGIHRYFHWCHKWNLKLYVNRICILLRGCVNPSRIQLVTTVSLYSSTDTVTVVVYHLTVSTLAPLSMCIHFYT